MIRILTGDTEKFIFTIVYSDGSEQSVPDLSEATVVFAIEKEQPIITKSVVHSGSNIIVFELTPEETDAIPPSVYSACCKIYYDDGVEKTVWNDSIAVVKGVLSAELPSSDSND